MSYDAITHLFDGRCYYNGHQYSLGKCKVEHALVPQETQGYNKSTEVIINRGQIVRQSSTLGLVRIMLQEFDLGARWTSMIQDLYAEAVHNLAQKWPDEQSSKFHIGL